MLNMMKSIGIDIGTTSICGVAVDMDGKRIVKSVTKANDSALIGKTFERLQDTNRILAICKAIYAELSGGSEEVCSVGVTGQMHGILYLDDRGIPVSPLYTWQDQRGDELFFGGKTYAQYLSEATGYKMAAGYGLTTHFYNLKNHLVPKTAKKLCTVQDFVAMNFARLATPVMHCSDSASLGLFDIPKGEFSETALDALNICADILPVTVNEPTVIGEVKNRKIFTAIGDNQASVFGSLRTDENLLINIGTGSQVSMISKLYYAPSGVEIRPYLKNDYLIVGCALSGGYAYSLLKNFYEEVFKMAGIEPPQNLYGYMNQSASGIRNDGNRIEASTSFNGTRENPHLKASFRNVDAKNFTPSHVTYSVLCGIANELYELFAKFPLDLKTRVKGIVGSGNGIRKNKLLQEILSQKFKKPLTIPEFEEEASYGVAMMAFSLM